MSINELQDEVIAEFSDFDDWMVYSIDQAYWLAVSLKQNIRRNKI